MSDLRENPQENPRENHRENHQENPHWNTRCLVHVGILGSAMIGYITFLCTYVSSKMNATTGACLDCKVAAALTAFVTLAVCFAVLILGRVFFQEPAEPTADHTGPSGGTGGCRDGSVRRGSGGSARRGIGGRHGNAPDVSRNVGGSPDGSGNVGGAADVGGSRDGSGNVGVTPDGSGNVGGPQDGSGNVGGAPHGSGNDRARGGTRGSTGGGGDQQRKNWIILELVFTVILVILCSTGMVLACFYTNCWQHRQQVGPTPPASPLTLTPSSPSSPTTPSTITPNVSVSLPPGFRVTDSQINDEAI